MGRNNGQINRNKTLTLSFKYLRFTDKKNAPATQTDRPWHCLVSYVDDLTVGGRRNSKGLYEDPMSYPSFGNKKPQKVPDDCFPQHCYTRFTATNIFIFVEIPQFITILGVRAGWTF